MSSTETIPAGSHGSPAGTLRLWLALIVATLLTWQLGEGSGSLPLTVAVLGIALLKGAAVALDFMALRHAPPLWRNLLLGWLLFVCALIGLAYWKGIA
ncbi:MAG: cytochrome C oxidase subunit IV family protein [Zoogloea oleivorans]|jgi:caa(3)-type oxidase subunit IV|uniref:cytochrome C oxidase subunit IV family protein n=1 Tax=Zoogloea oleivorans TaxID=1552750 RepID=UPI002A36341E|nr:cytochrome C oxidase subunit IV family protein [Zoogloea oleivorans]MDY0038394.1 cytochrome C oxidase subunit IV family protein [Zoogloea oleivorans]